MDDLAVDVVNDRPADVVVVVSGRPLADVVEVEVGGDGGAAVVGFVIAVSVMCVPVICALAVVHE